MYTVDFETLPIVGNSVKDPPKPIGVSIKLNAEVSCYYEGKHMLSPLRAIWDGEEPILFHNAPFDLRVAEVHLGLPRPRWDRVHDTMYLVFFEDPYGALGLKPCAERYLGWPNDEQNALKAWIFANVPRVTEKSWGAEIYRAPLELIAPYAEADTDMTYGLYQHLKRWHGADCYKRERKLSPTFISSTIRGIRVNRSLLAQHIPVFKVALERARAVLRVTLGVGIGVNLNSPIQLADALDKGRFVDGWETTPKGARSTKKENLRKHIVDINLLNLMDYIGSLETSLNTFMDPWLADSEEDGRIYPEWNQIRNFEKGKSAGTRTGRPSCSKPNLLNVPTEYDITTPEELEVTLPFCRIYLLPEEGHVWLKRDYASQEIRIAAHFADGELMSIYNEDPDFDPHEMARKIILHESGIALRRKQVKIMAFRIIYGGGAPAVAGALNKTIEEGANLKRAYLRAVPDIANLAKDTKNRGYANLPIHTWGGREYYTQPPSAGRSYEYKLMNYLVQGSAADQTKQCINDWDDTRDADELFIVTVYDEIDISVPIEKAVAGMQRLKYAMEQDFFDVPMLTDGFTGPNWNDLTACE